MKKSFWENVVLAAIVLVLVQTFFEDFAVIAGWPWRVRLVLLFLGFFFDLFFTAEFLVRLYAAAVNRRASEYFLHERGWVDFAASVPLAVFNSGPAVLGILAGGVPVAVFGGSINILKIVKAVRIARILRLLRVLKIFRQIKNTDSVMAQRHLIKISGVIVTGFVFALFVFSSIQTASGRTFLEGEVQEQYHAAASSIAASAEIDKAGQSAAAAKIVTGLLVVKQEGRTLYSRYDTPYYKTFFGPWDYAVVKEGAFEFFFDLRPIASQQSRDNLSYFVVILVLLAVLLLYYSPHFALTVSDPIHVMYRGFSEGGYNLEARIPKRFRDDDVYRLAEKYNDEYLPLKDRTERRDASQGSELKIEDLGDLFRKG